MTILTTHLATHGLTMIARWRSNGPSKRCISSKRATWLTVDARSLIEWMRLNCTVLIKRRVISAVDRDGSLDPTVTPKILYKTDVLHERKLTLGFSSEIELSRHHNLRVNWFLSLLDTFPCPRSAWNRKLIEGVRRILILNSNFCLRNCGMNSHASGD